MSSIESALEEPSSSKGAWRVTVPEAPDPPSAASPAPPSAKGDPPALVFLDRAQTIEYLTELVSRCQRERRVSFRRAMKLVAPEVGLTNIAVRRLVDLYPDN